MLKQETEKAAKTAGRAPRLVSLSDGQYVSQLEMMVAMLKIPLERRNKRTGRTEKARIREITDRTVSNWLERAIGTAERDEVRFSIPVSQHTFGTASQCTCYMATFTRRGDEWDSRSPSHPKCIRSFLRLMLPPASRFGSHSIRRMRCCQGQRLIVKAQQKGKLAMVLSSLNRARVSGQHCL